MKKIFLCKRSIIIVSAIAVIHLVNNLQAQTEENKFSSAVASYENLSKNIYLRSWSILGPISNEGFLPEDKNKPEGNQAFEYDYPDLVKKNNDILLPVTFQDKIYEWNLFESESDQINLIKLFGDTTHVISYAYAEIASDEEFTSLWGLGSDDGIKIWVNGEQIHSNNISRAVEQDDDVIEIRLKKGKNNILIKLQNGNGDYGFMLRPLNEEIVNKLLINSVFRGDLDEIKKLIPYCSDINTKDIHGLNAWQVAKIKGRKNIGDFLKINGADTSAPFPSLEEVLTNRYSQLSKKGISPGSAILIGEKGKIVYKNGFGYANIETQTPFTSTTKFRIGSVSKQFTASAILKLNEEGKIELTDKLSKFIPDFPRGDEVSIHHLLTHTSGIHSYTNMPDFIDNVKKPVSKKKIIDIIKSEPYDFDPGTDYMYNNSGYFLLGHILETITNKSLDEYLKEAFFIPLGMENTGIYQKKLDLTDEALGYKFENDSFKLSIDWDMTWAGGAGALYSTIEDLFIWNEALFNKKVLKDTSLAKAFTPVLLNNDSIPYNNKYGYGWSLNPYRKIDLISHGGGLHGFVCFLLRQPEEEITIAVFTNCTPQYPNTNPYQVAVFLLEYSLWNQMSNQISYSKTETLSPKQLKEYLGRYDYGRGMVLTVNQKGNHLLAQLTGQPEFEIFPMGNDVFYWKVVEARIEFSRNSIGQITGGVHYQNGQKIPVQKLPEISSIELKKSELIKYCGSYEGDNNLEVKVFEKDDMLTAHIKNQPEIYLIPISKTEFVSKNVNAQISFKKENDNIIMTLSVGNKNFTLKRTNN
jgi:CubicO group peptidase (beta-lactamase class C family)